MPQSLRMRPSALRHISRLQDLRLDGKILLKKKTQGRKPWVHSFFYHGDRTNTMASRNKFAPPPEPALIAVIIRSTPATPF